MPLIEGGDAVASVAGVGGRHRKTRFGYFGECLRYCWALLLVVIGDAHGGRGDSGAYIQKEVILNSK